MNKKTIWKNIIGYEGIYLVSNEGSIKSIDRTNSKNRKFLGKVLKQSLSSGYFCVSLCKNGEQKTYRVHRLVAQAFLKNNKNKPEVNHKDGNKLNNNVCNLEWCSKLENNKHARKYKLIDSKKLNKPINQFSKDNVLLKSFESQRDAFNVTKICYKQINSCLKNKQKTAGGFIWKYQ